MNKVSTLCPHRGCGRLDRAGGTLPPRIAAGTPEFADSAVTSRRTATTAVAPH